MMERLREVFMAVRGGFDGHHNQTNTGGTLAKYRKCRSTSASTHV